MIHYNFHLLILNLILEFKFIITRIIKFNIFYILNYHIFIVFYQSLKLYLVLNEALNYYHRTHKIKCLNFD